MLEKIFKNLLKNKKPQMTTEELSAYDMQANNLVNVMKEHYLKKKVTLAIVEKDVSIFSSKIGGAYYLPDGMDIPVTDEKKEPLYLLAQLNFAELPHLQDFPEKGLLQFFISDDNLWGLETKGGFKVRYIAELPESSDITIIDDISTNLPFDPRVPLKIEGFVEDSIPGFGLYNFEQMVSEVAPEYIQLNKKGQLEFVEREVEDRYYDASASSGSCIDGYPCIIQGDPRYFNNEFDTLLLQVDSDSNITWGDCGAAHFFINREKLRNLDFSEVLYQWDCY